MIVEYKYETRIQKSQSENFGVVRVSRSCAHTGKKWVRTLHVYPGYTMFWFNNQKFYDGTPSLGCRYCVWNLVLILFTVDDVVSWKPFQVIKNMSYIVTFKKVKIYVHLIWFNKSHVLLCIGWSMVEKHYYFCKLSLRQLRKMSELQKFKNFHKTGIIFLFLS